MSERKILDCLSFTNFDIKYIYASEFLKFSEGMINLDKVLSALIFWFFGIKAKEQKYELKLKFRYHVLFIFFSSVSLIGYRSREPRTSVCFSKETLRLRSGQAKQKKRAFLI